MKHGGSIDMPISESEHDALTPADDDLRTMSDEEIDAELRAVGFDPAEVAEVGRRLGEAIGAAVPGEEVGAVKRVFLAWRLGDIKAPAPAGKP